MNRLTAGLCLAALASLGTATAQTVVNLTPTADTYTQQGTPTTNYGTQTTILIRRDPAGTLTRGAYFQFDLSGLPAGTITNARLQLFGSQDQGGTGIDTKIHGGTNTATWSETALNYNNSLQLTSTDFSGTPLTTLHVNPPPAANYSWDVTSFIASRRSVGHATLGLGYVTTDTYRSTFNSKEAASNRPLLIVTIGGGGGGDTTPPSSPGAVSFSSITSSSVTASWGAATDNVGVAGYDYRVNSGSWVSIGNVLSTSISGLSPSTSYTISVRARDAAGNVSVTPSSNSFTTSAGGGGGTMNWAMFGHDYENTRFSPDTTISASNVGTLHALWRNSSPTVGSTSTAQIGGIAGTPVIVDGIAYVSDFNGWVRAINATTGAQVWRTQVTPTGSTLRQNSPSVFVTADTVYAGGNIGMVYALNRSTGALRWQRQIESTPNSRVSSSPMVVGNTLIVGSGSYQVWVSATPMFRGSVKFVNATTGALLPYTVDMCPSAQCGGGVTVWSTAAVDTATSTGFIGTGQAYVAPAGPYSDALVAFDINTGAKKWVAQFEANDVWRQGLNITNHDHDIGAAPNLFTVNGTPAVGVGNKGGFYRAYNRNTGALLWSHNFGAFSPLGGMMYAAAYNNGVIYAVSNDRDTGGTGANARWPAPARARAINANTGATIWSVALTQGGFGGVAVANGLMYFATWNGVLHVLNTANGAEVRSLQIGTSPGGYVAAPDAFPNGSASGPMVYNGRVYVGYGWTWVLNIDGGLTAFGL